MTYQVKRLLIALGYISTLSLQSSAVFAQGAAFIATVNGTNSITITPPTGNLCFRLKQ